MKYCSLNYLTIFYIPVFLSAGDWKFQPLMCAWSPLLKYVILMTHNAEFKLGFVEEDLRKNSRLEVYCKGCVGCVCVGDGYDNHTSFQKQES